MLCSILALSCSKKENSNKAVLLNSAARTVNTQDLTIYHPKDDIDGKNPCYDKPGNCLPEVTIIASKKAFMGELINVVNSVSKADDIAFFESTSNYENLSFFFTDEQINAIKDGTNTLIVNHPEALNKTFIFKNVDDEIVSVVPVTE